MTTSLGKILKEKAAADAVAAAARVQRQQENAAVRVVADRKETVELFASFKEQIETAILKTLEFPALRLRSNDGSGRIQRLLGVYELDGRIDNSSHANHDVWVEFTAWGRAQEVSISIAYNFSDECNEAGPEESWYELRGEAV
jgi:hypothetical protein